MAKQNNVDLVRYKYYQQHTLLRVVQKSRTKFDSHNYAHEVPDEFNVVYWYDRDIQNIEVIVYDIQINHLQVDYICADVTA